MRFFENTRKPQGFGGKLMTKMMNSGHAKLSQWGFSNISASLMLKFWTSAVAAEQILRSGLIDVEMAT